MSTGNFNQIIIVMVIQSTGPEVKKKYIVQGQHLKEEFEDTKGVIKMCKLMNRQTDKNGQKKKYKRTNNSLQNIQN